MKERSASLAIRETQIKTTVKYHLAPVRMGIINKTSDNKCCRGCEEKKKKLSFTAGGMETGTAIMENIMEFPKKN